MVLYRTFLTDPYSCISTGMFLIISSKCLLVFKYSSLFNKGRNKLMGFPALNSSGNPISVGVKRFPTRTWSNTLALIFCWSKVSRSFSLKTMCSGSQDEGVLIRRCSSAFFKW